MKKLLILAFTFSFALLLTGCFSQKDVATPVNEPEEVVVEPVDEPEIITEEPTTADCNADIDCFIKENIKDCTAATYIPVIPAEEKLPVESNKKATIEPYNDTTCLLTVYGLIEEGKKYTCGITKNYLTSWAEFIGKINEPENGLCTIENM